MTYNNKEELLHFIWESRLYPPDSLETTDGRKIEVLHPGMRHSQAGRGYLNAKIRIGDRLLTGDVEIHPASVHPEEREHYTDRDCSAVILYLSGCANGTEVYGTEEYIPLCELPVPDVIRKNVEYLTLSHNTLPCREHLPVLPPVYIRLFLSALTVERLERKVNDIYARLDHFRHSWDDVFYVLLARNFGFGLNGDAFEQLALSLPLSHIRRHGDSLFQVEALLFGQAGLLEDAELPAPEAPGTKDHRETPERKAADDYYLYLQQEYRFLKNKYALTPLDARLFRRIKVRPRSCPEIRIAQLAVLLQSSSGQLFSAVLAQEKVDAWMSLFRISPSVYWHTHCTFGERSPESDGRLGDASLQILLINTVTPILFAYGRKTGDADCCDRAVRLLESLNPERNVIVSDFRKAGVIARNAFDTQALIQLRRAYCNPRKCLSCRIGYKLLASESEYLDS
ncbi:MAG: DUF2851 family protein [Proteiniphilum sp.]|nr:DUF2851 family protein [Proteiniphilum sp.]